MDDTGTSFLFDEGECHERVSCGIQPFSNQGKYLLSLDSYCRLYCRFGLVFIDFQSIQFTHTKFSTAAGYGGLIYLTHWLIEEVSFVVDLFISAAPTSFRNNLDRCSCYANVLTQTSEVCLSS